MSKKLRKEGKQALNLSINPKILELLDTLMTQRRYTSASVFIEELIRGEYERHIGHLGTAAPSVPGFAADAPGSMSVSPKTELSSYRAPTRSSKGKVSASLPKPHA